MKAICQFGEGGAFELRTAILLYGHEGQHEPDKSALATIHPVRRDAQGRTTILPGHAPDPSAIQETLFGLLQRKPAGLLPANLLYLSLTRMMWYRPAAPAPIWFKVDRGSKALNKISGETVPHPHLLFMVDGGQMYLFALAKPGRPEGGTPIMRAPYYNINDAGGLCIGSARMPSHDLHPDAIPKYERGFFESNFTHPTGGRLSKNPGGHDALWPSIAKRKTFPHEHLIPQPQVPSGAVPVRIRPFTLRNLLAEPA